MEEKWKETRSKQWKEIGSEERKEIGSEEAYPRRQKRGKKG